VSGLTIAEQAGFTDEDLDLLEQRKSPDITLRQFMRVSALQVRAALYRDLPPGVARDVDDKAMLAFMDEFKAMPPEPTMGLVNDLNTRYTRAQNVALEACEAARKAKKAGASP